jgi:transposase
VIPAVLERCAGIDVGKKFLMVCLMIGAPHKEPSFEVRRFETTVSWIPRSKRSTATANDRSEY